VRFDQTLSAKDSVFVTYVFDQGNTTLPDVLNTVNSYSGERRQTVSAVYNHIFSDALYNSFRVGGTREYVNTLVTLPGQSAAANDLSYGSGPGLYAPAIQISSLANFGGGLNSSGATNYGFTTPQAYDDVFLTRGHHTIKVGFAYEHIMDNMLIKTTPDGVFKFTSLANYLQNIPASLQVQITPTIPRDIRQNVFGGYVEDDWRFRPNLTFTLGARYETASVPTETAGRLSNLESLTATAPVIGNPLFQNPTRKNIEPRVGFTYSPASMGNKMTISGGYGIFDVLPLTYQFNLMVTQNAPFIINVSDTTLPKGSFPTAAYALTSTVGTGKPRETYIQFNPPRNYVQQYNLTLQQDLFWNLNLKVAWVGSHGVHQAFRTTDANIPTPTVASNGQLIFPCAVFTIVNISCKTAAPVINPAFGQIDGQQWNSGSSYNGLLLQVKQQRKQFQWQASFTWQKSLDGNSSVIAGGPFLNSISGQLLAHPLRGLSDFDVPKVFVINGFYTVPDVVRKGSFASYAVNGWEVAGIFQASDGTPFTPVFAGDVNGDGNTVPFDVPNRITTGPGCTGNPIFKHQFYNYINQACFVVPVNTSSLPGTAFGNAGRNSILGPGFAELDFSLLKNIAIPALGESTHLQLRAELFNIANRPNISAPLTNNKFAIPATATASTQTQVAPSGSTGLATTSSNPRQIQLGAKFIF
jgi:hypothetical protein